MEAMATLNYTETIWMIILLVLVLLGVLLVLFLLLCHQKNNFVVDGKREKLPSQLSPLMVGVLVHKKLYPDALAAFVLDLCQRGYLVIVKNGEHSFSLAKRKTADEHLTIWEKEIFEQLLPDGAKSVSDKILAKNSERLFNSEIHQAVGLIYRTCTKLGYFQENPHITRIRYKLIGLALYFVGFIGLVIVAVNNYSPMLLWPLGLLVVIAYGVFHLANRQVNYSAEGLKIRQDWLELGNYLCDSKKLPAGNFTHTFYEKYLPYAVALGCAEQFTARFKDLSPTKVTPDWFISHKENSAVELSEDILKFVEKVGLELIILKGPQVN